ncbi:MAG TPA: NAD-dependent epimerase/dehydratase family protein [Armatimonadota bacterium]|nr:NAD-dependent epimerase/dehydratase family protein [Armatimonadota bacterium]
MSRILVTGGAGFIASHLVDALVGEGHEVAIIDNLSTGKEANVNPAATLNVVDIRDAVATAKAIEDFRPEIIHHLAAQASVVVSTEDPALDAQTNIIGSLNVLVPFRKIGGRRFISTSSGGAVYGDPAELPVKESAPGAPICPYGVSKYAFEVYLRAAHAESGLDFVIMRYSNVYGPRQDPHGEAGVIAIFTSLLMAGKEPHIFGDGEATRDYIHVSDIVAANMAAMDAPAQSIFNVGTGVATSVNELTAALVKATGYDGEIIHDPARPGEVRHTYLDCTRLRETTGWAPKYEITEGIQNTVDWFRE